MKAANASAPPAEGVGALFASLLNDAPQMPGSAAQALNNVLPQVAANLPTTGAGQIAKNVATAQPPETQIIQAASNVALQQVSTQTPANVPAASNTNSNSQQPPANNSAQDALLNAPAIVTTMTAGPEQPAVQNADNKAPPSQVSKPKDKLKDNPAPQVAAVPVFVPLPQMSVMPTVESDAVGDVTSKPAQPVIAQQALDHTQSAVIQTQAQVEAPALPHEQSSPAPQTAQISASVKFDLSPHTGGQSPQSGSREQQNSPDRQTAPIQNSAPSAAPPQVQMNSATAPLAPQALSVAALTPALHAPVHANIVVQSAPQNSAPMSYDIGAMAISIAAKAQGDDHHFDIRLDPPELGSIAVHLTVDHTGQAAAHLTADKPETLQLLQSDSTNLQSALKDAGLNLANNGLNFSLRGEQRQAGQSFQRGNSRARNLSVSAVAAPTATSASVSSYAPGALDIII